MKSLAIFAPNGAWFPSNLTELLKRYEGDRHVPHETIRQQTSQSQKTPSTQGPRAPQATARPGPALYRGPPSGPEGLGFPGYLGGRDRRSLAGPTKAAGQNRRAHVSTLFGCRHGHELTRVRGWDKNVQSRLLNALPKRS